LRRLTAEPTYNVSSRLSASTLAAVDGETSFEFVEIDVETARVMTEGSCASMTTVYDDVSQVVNATLCFDRMYALVKSTANSTDEFQLDHPLPLVLIYVGIGVFAAVVIAGVLWYHFYEKQKRPSKVHMVSEISVH
jgi:hypothetical protein